MLLLPLSTPLAAAAAIVGRRGRQGDGHVAGALVDSSGPAQSTRPVALDDRPLVHVGALDPQLVGVELVVRLGVGHGRVQELQDLARHAARGVGEDLPGPGHRLAADVLHDEAGLARRAADVLGLRPNGHGVVAHRTLTRSLPAWPRKVRVGANSPSLWPTIDSEMKTGTCLRPSWTAIVWPTISGKIVEARDQVLIICLSPEEFIASMRASRRSSTHGPFLEDLDIAYLLPFPRRRRRTMKRSDGLRF